MIYYWWRFRWCKLRYCTFASVTRWKALITIKRSLSWNLFISVSGCPFPWIIRPTAWVMPTRTKPLPSPWHWGLFHEWLDRYLRLTSCVWETVLHQKIFSDSTQAVGRFSVHVRLLSRITELYKPGLCSPTASPMLFPTGHGHLPPVSF